MDENKSAVDDFLGNLNPENDEFNNKNDVFGENNFFQEEKKVEEQEEVKTVPFHKDPKIMRFIEKEVEKRIPKVEPKEVTKEDEDDYYVRLIGNDTPEKVAMIREAKLRDEKLLSQAEERAFNRLSKSQQEAIEAKQRKDEALANSIDEIEETFKVDLTSKDPIARKNRVDFLNFIEKLAPKDANGNVKEYPDTNSAFETFQEMRKTTSTSSKAKEIATRSMARSGDTIPAPQERTTFENLDGIFERIFKN